MIAHSHKMAAFYLPAHALVLTSDDHLGGNFQLAVAAKVPSRQKAD